MIRRTAVLSTDGVYRYRLGRRWHDGPTMCWVMLNPSTADHSTDDATIRRCMWYARREGCGAIDVVNLYAYRATQPDDLVAAHRDGADVVGPENVAHVTAAVDAADVVVFAWGGNADRIVAAPTPNVTAFCLGFTASGQPRHPGRLGNGVPFEPYLPRDEGLTIASVLGVYPPTQGVLGS